MTTDFRERKQHERAQRIAERIHAAKRSGVPLSYPDMNAMAVPVAGGWKVPEPSPETLEYFAQTAGFPEADRGAKPAPGATEVKTMEDRIAEGVAKALRELGIGVPRG